MTRPQPAWLLVVPALVAVALPLLLGGNTYLIGVATTTVLFAIYASGWNIVAGYAGQFSFGHSAFVGIGAYFSTLLLVGLKWPTALTILLGGLAAAVAGVLIGLPAFRLRGPYFALTTIAFSEILRLAVGGTDKLGPFPVGGPTGVILPVAAPSLLGITLTDNSAYYELFLGFLIVVLLATWWLSRSRIGHYWAAIRTDQEAASSLGVPVLRFKCYAAMISGFVVGIGGALLALYVGFIDPNSTLGIDLSIQIALMGLIGGRATVLGPTIGAAILFPLGEATRAQFGATAGAHLVLYGIVLMVAIYFLPKGVVFIGDLIPRRKPRAVEARRAA